MKTPQSVWDEFGAIKDNDMAPFREFIRGVASGRCLEIGVCRGVSTAAFLLGFDDHPSPSDHLYSIDVEPCRIFDDHRWTFIQGASQVCYVPAGEFNVILVDGDHSYDAVKSDLARFAPKVAPGGILLAHDVAVEAAWQQRAAQWFDVVGCARAWQEFVATKNPADYTVLRGQTGMGLWRNPK